MSPLEKANRFWLSVSGESTDFWQAVQRSGKYPLTGSAYPVHYPPALKASGALEDFVLRIESNYRALGRALPW